MDDVESATGDARAEVARLVRELGTARENLRSLVDACPVATLTLDLEMNVTMWNPAATSMFGWAADEVLGARYPIVPPDEFESFGVLFARVVSGEGFTGVEGRRRRKDGSAIDLRIHTTPLRAASGEVVGALALLEDLTEQKRLEAQMRQSQQMEAIGRLAGGVAHDFNNVLAVVLGMSELLLAKAHRAPPEFASGLTEIQRAAERARALTAQLLAFARRQVSRPEVCDVNVLVERTAPLLRHMVGDSITLELALASVPVGVRVDGSQFDQVLMNLVLNARDAMPHGGCITISTELDEDATGDSPLAARALLSVRDEGMGIASESLPHIFEPFYTTKAQGEGTGLGLATVYAIVTQAGGGVEVDSALGRGTTVRVSLPHHAIAVQSTSEPDARPRTPRGAGRRVLLVEDEPAVGAVMQRLVEGLGYRVTLAMDGVEALARVRDDESIELVLTDLSMPRLGGRELGEAVAKLRPTLPVVFMSANLDVPELREAIESGAGAFLQKPVTRAALAERLHASLTASARGTTRAAGRSQGEGAMHITSHDGAAIAARTTGASGRPLLLLHGWMTSGVVWDALLPELAKAGYRCIVPDLRGVAGSAAAPGPFDLETAARDVCAVLDALALEAPVLVGHSMGGQIAQRVAASWPERVTDLLLLNPVPAAGLPLPDEVVALFRTAGGDAAKLGAILDMATNELDAAARERLVAAAVAIDPHCIEAYFDAWRAGGFADRLGAITARTLVVSTDDPFLPPALLDVEVTSRIHGARREHLAGPGHYPQVERPRETAALVAEFMRRSAS